MLTDIVPAYLHPHSAANEAVILYDGPVTFQHDRGEASGTGTLALRWVPSTGLRLRVVIGSGKAPRSDGSATAFLGGGEGNFQAFSWNTNLADGQMTETVEGRIRCFRKGDGTDLASIGFQVVNFTDFLTPGPKTPPIFGFPPQTVDLDSGMWRVRLSATANHQAIFKSLKEQGGYAFTHLGRLERIDGATFSAEDADGPLHTLFRFLGFARGAAANLPIRWGVNPSGDTIWEEWCSPVVDQWKTPQNWFDENHGNLLREIFPAFVRAYEDPNLNEPLSLALHWYQACNTRAGGMEGALVLGVTNLDLLAALVVVDKLKNRSASKFDGLKAREKLTALLQSLGVGLGVPPGYADLAGFAAGNAWPDAAWTLTEMRHGYVHANPRRRKVVLSALNRATFEAWQLSLWYQELALLYLLDHSGEYQNRVTAESRGDVETVPWD